MIRSIALLLSFALLAPPVWTQSGGALGGRRSKVDGSYVLEYYAGNRARATAKEVQRFVLDERLAQLDRDDSWPVEIAGLDLTDFATGWLHVPLRPPANVDALRVDRAAPAFTPRASGMGTVTLNDLEASPTVFWSVVSVLLWEQQWPILKSFGAGPYTKAELDEFLKKRKSKKKTTPIVSRLRVAAKDGVLERGEHARFDLREHLVALDTDGNGELDPWEFAVGFPGLETGKVHAAFVDWMNAKMLVQPGDALMPATGPTFGVIGWAMRRALPKWEAIVQQLGGDVTSKFTVEEVGREIARVARAKAEAKAKKDAAEQSRVFANEG